MVKLVSCSSCGSVDKQTWGEKSICRECGGPMEQVDVDLGMAEKLPRSFNIIGVIFLLAAGAVIAVRSSGGGLSERDAPLLLLLCLLGVLSLAVSLFVQIRLGTKALQEYGRKRTRRKKKLSRGHDAVIKGGPVEKTGIKRVSKIYTGRKIR